MYEDKAREIGEKYGNGGNVALNSSGLPSDTKQSELRELNQAKKKGDFVEITDQAIEKVKPVSVPGMSLEEIRSLQLAHMKLLEESMLYNASREVMHILVPGGNPIAVYGDHNSVNPGSSPTAAYIINSFKDGELTVIHNHPGLSGFSLNDLAFFLNHDSVGTLTIVTNRGKVMYMTKDKLYDRRKAWMEARRLVNDPHFGVDNLDSVIKKLYNVGIKSKVR